MNTINRSLLRVALFGLTLAFFASTTQAIDEPSGRYLPPVQVAGWQLGVGVKNLRGGCAITRVLPVSSAKEVGLEVGDIILSVNGVPVGFAGGNLNDLEDELNRQADALGRVVLRVRNGRNGGVVTVPVRLTPAQQWRPPVAPPWWDWRKPQPPIVEVPPVVVPPTPPVVVVPPVAPPVVVVPPTPPVDPVRDNIEKLYLRYFGRRPDHQGMHNWLTQVSRGMRIEEVHANILASAEFYDRCQNNPEEWVAQLYLLLTERRGTGREIGEWVANLNRYGGQRLPLARDFLKAIGQY